MSDEYKSLMSMFKNMYAELHRAKPKLTDDSVFITVIGMNSNDRYQLLSKCSMEKGKIPRKELSDLRANNLVQETDEVNKITLTAKGLWVAENVHLKRDLKDIVIEYMETKFFSVFEKSIKPLKDKDKIILLTMIALRVFSEKSSIDLYNQNHEKWAEVLSHVGTFAKRNGIIHSDPDKLIKKKQGDTIISDLLRHANELPKQTRSIYVPNNNRKFYLQIDENGDLQKEKIAFLIKLLIGELKPTRDLILKINDFLKNASYNYSVYFFNPKDHIYAKPKVDDVLKEVLIEL